MAPRHKSDTEKYIGENLINKIGIAITTIGFIIGAEYAIEQELINPLLRVTYGYLPGLGLLFFGLRIKKKYENYSATIVCISLAIMYTFSYVLYNVFDLVPQNLAFILMVAFTIFIIVAAILYKRQVIAHIGLVGAYVVPFLFSDDFEKIEMLFGYIAVINVSILVIAFINTWKRLYYSSFILTWLQFLLWYVSDFRAEEHYGLTLIFLYIFFSTFYVTFLIYKILRRSRFETLDILLVLTNSFIFFGVGYVTLSGHAEGEQLLGLFTICMALVHLVLSVIIYWQKLDEKVLFYLVSALVVVFTSVAIPIQFNGNLVTILWGGEAAILFWIGRGRNVPIYEKLSYPVMLIAFVSLVQDWSIGYDTYYTIRPETRIIPFINFNFLTSLIFIIFFGVINILNFKIKFSSPSYDEWTFLKISSFFMSAFLLFAMYWSFLIEIATYWDQLSTDLVMTLDAHNQPYLYYQLKSELNNIETLWILSYTLLFLSIVSFANIKIVRSQKLSSINLTINAVTIATYLTYGLYILNELNERIIQESLSDNYFIDFINSYLRYISMILVAVLLIVSKLYARQDFVKMDFRVAFDLLLYITAISILSSEYIKWMNIFEPTQSSNFGLTILWGIYSFLLVIVGIWRKKRPLRIAAVILFVVMLVKLLVFDISNLTTVAMVIVFISLGILLLITSFLYHKKSV